MIGIGIITYNRLNSLKACLASVRKFTTHPYRLVVADDGSTDGTTEYCRLSSTPYVTGPNHGIATNKNRALDYLRYCDSIFLIEDDVRILKPGWYRHFTLASQQSGNHHFVYNMRRTPEDKMDTFGTYQVVYHKLSNGFFLFLTQTVIEKVGGFDPRFGTYGFEHFDYTYRIFKAGLTRGLNPHLPVTEPYLYLDQSVKAILPSDTVHASIQKNQKILQQSRDETDAGQIFRPIPVLI